MKRLNTTGLAVLTTLSATPLLAHPGINDRSDILAAAHDLTHAAVVYPVLAGLILGLAVAGFVAFRVSHTSRRRHRELLNTESNR
jgi:uncharacterized protein (DUF2062 family)